MIRVPVDPLNPAPEALATAVGALRHGGVVAMPTDTLYGLAVDPRNELAVAALFRAKGRAADRAVPLVAADLVQVEQQVGRLSPLTRRLADRFWPGPLSLLVDAERGGLVADVHGGAGVAAVRVPAHAVPRRLAQAAGHLLTATSANRSGQPPARTADDVDRSVLDRLSVILDAGSTPGGLPSTIVDARRSEPRLIRAGAVSWERVLQSVK